MKQRESVQKNSGEHILGRHRLCLEQGNWQKISTCCWETEETWWAQLWSTLAVMRQRGGTERALLLQLPRGTEKVSSSGLLLPLGRGRANPGHQDWCLLIWQGTCKKHLTHTPLPQTGQTKHGLAQDKKNLSGESTPLLDGLTSSPELLELQILRNWKSLAGHSSLAVPGYFEVSLYGQY